MIGEHEAGWDPRYDDGLTRERTLLAWDRTALAFVVNAGVMAKGFQGTNVEPLGYIFAAIGVGLGGITYRMGGFRFANRFWHKRVDRARDRAFRTLSLGSTTLAAAAVVLMALAT